MCKFEVDFVILWVDSNDKQWQAEKAKYNPNATDDVGYIRYQDWDNLRFWFRTVDKYASWVRKIHLVTCGQVPKWLNIDNPKINLVKHSDYMPLDALPTFNSSAIEIGIHRIQDLAQNFVLFNDDMFLTAPVSQNYFFNNEGVPYDMPGFIRTPKKTEGNIFSTILYNNSMVLRKYFTKKQILDKRLFEWLNFRMGKSFIRSLKYIFQKDFPGFVMPHLSTPYLKSDFKKVWNKEKKVLIATQYHRFRNENDVTHFLVRNWRMCEKAYVPKKSTGKYFSVDGEKTAQKVALAIKNNLYPEICINEVCTGQTFEIVKTIVNSAFSETLFEKCQFEK